MARVKEESNFLKEKKGTLQKESRHDSSSVMEKILQSSKDFDQIFHARMNTLHSQLSYKCQVFGLARLRIKQVKTAKRETKVQANMNSVFSGEFSY